MMKPNNMVKTVVLASFLALGAWQTAAAADGVHISKTGTADSPVSGLADEELTVTLPEAGGSVVGVDSSVTLVYVSDESVKAAFRQGSAGVLSSVYRGSKTFSSDNSTIASFSSSYESQDNAFVGDTSVTVTGSELTDGIFIGTGGGLSGRAVRITGNTEVVLENSTVGRTIGLGSLSSGTVSQIGDIVLTAKETTLTYGEGVEDFASITGVAASNNGNVELAGDVRIDISGGSLYDAAGIGVDYSGDGSAVSARRVSVSLSDGAVARGPVEGIIALAGADVSVESITVSSVGSTANQFIGVTAGEGASVTVAGNVAIALENTTTTGSLVAVYAGWDEVDKSTGIQTGDVAVTVAGGSVASGLVGPYVGSISNVTVGNVTVSAADAGMWFLSGIRLQDSGTLTAGSVVVNAVGLSPTSTELLVMALEGHEKASARTGSITLNIRESALAYDYAGAVWFEGDSLVVDGGVALSIDNASVKPGLKRLVSVYVNPSSQDGVQTHVAITGDVNLTYRQTTDTLEGGSTEAEVLGVLVESGASLSLSGNVNVTLEGTASGLGLTGAVFGTEADVGSTFTMSGVRTLTFGTANLSFESGEDDPFMAGFVNFDRVVVAAGSRLSLTADQSKFRVIPTTWLDGIRSFGGTIAVPTGTQVTVQKGAELSVCELNLSGRLVLEGGTSVVKADSIATSAADRTVSTGVSVAEAAGTGEIVFEGALPTDGTASVSAGTLTGSKPLTVTITSAAAEGLSAESSEASGQIQRLFAIGSNETGFEVVVQETQTGLLGGRTLLIDAAGSLVSAAEQKSSVARMLTDNASAAFLSFRSSMNDLDKRMGDLRNMPEAAGGWARVYGGKNRYRTSSLSYRYSALQIGADIRSGGFYAGASLGYTDGKSKFPGGKGEDDTVTGALYAGYLADDGQFVDAIVKRSRTDTDYGMTSSVGAYSGGSYHNWMNSVSIEYGRRFMNEAGGYAEPQFEILYGRISKAHFATSRGLNVTQHAAESLAARFGIALGYVFPQQQGSVYGKASVLNDFKGKTKTTVSNGGVSRFYTEDLGGAWAEFAVGGMYRATDRLSVYGEFVSTVGTAVKTPWQWSAGVRYAF